MNAKYSLALIALVEIGVFALPSTMALFSGQHSFYNIDATGNQIPCTKCHGDVKAELSSNANTDPTRGPLTAGPHAAFKCEYCHRMEQGSASGDNAYGYIYYNDPLTNKTVRYLIVTVADMESGNYPLTFSNTINTTGLQAVTDLQNATGIIFTKVAKNSLPGASLGQSKPGATTGNLTYGQLKLKSLYNPDGTTLDSNNDTKNTGFNPTLITWTNYSTPVFNGAGSKAINPGSKYHAASLVSCMECHGGEEPLGHYSRVLGASELNSTGSVPCSNCHYGGGGSEPLGVQWTQLAAGGFGLTAGSGDPALARDTGEVEAHNAFVTQKDDLNRYSKNLTESDNLKYGRVGQGASNGACVACHTHVAVEINFKKGYLFQFNATEDALGNYTVDNFMINGTVNVTTYGNASGNTFAVSNSTYDWNSDTQLYLNGNQSTSVIGLQNSANDSAAALTP